MRKKKGSGGNHPFDSDAANSSSPPRYPNKITMLNFQNQPSNFTGVNIRKHKDAMSLERGSNMKPVKIEHEAERSMQQVVERIAHKTRTGFIPQMRKVNQDAYFY